MPQCSIPGPPVDSDCHLTRRVPRTSMRMRGLYEDPGGSILPKVRAGTLVIYVFSKTDLEYEHNLRFFIQHGMWEGDGCDYAIIVQQVRHTDE